MYSVDMKNIVPRESLTCLVAKEARKAIQSLIFTWVFFLASKDETSGILKSFITQIENLVDKKVKIIRCDNGTEFKNRVMSEFCEKKGIKREFSVARTPQQNGVAERRNKTLIEDAKTMLADSKLPTTFWAEVVNTACYVQNRESRRAVPELVADSSQAAVTESTKVGGTKRAAEEELDQHSSKKQKTDELSQEELQQLMIIVPEEGMNIEALQTKYPIIDSEIYSEDSRMYWKIIRVGNHIEVYQVFEDMLKNFDMDDLVKLWSLVQERFNLTEPT
ncbi:putative ribonuclease H-like domain-containing protein [Tanacetum coccineum]